MAINFLSGVYLGGSSELPTQFNFTFNEKFRSRGCNFSVRTSVVIIILVLAMESKCSAREEKKSAWENGEYMTLFLT